MNTPWGRSDSKTTLTRGISWVGTPSHGGFMVSLTAASKYLSDAAVKRGLKYGRYLAFEEDCDYAIVALELPEQLFKKFPMQPKQTLISGLSSWHADYLIERGIEPTAAGLKFFNENRQHDRMRQDKSPDLVVSATGSIASWVPEGMVGVITADGSYWLVPAEEYANRNTNLTLLSNFVHVEAVK